MPDKPESLNEENLGKNWNEISNRSDEEANNDLSGEETTEPAVVEEASSVLHEKLDAAKEEAKKNYDLFLRTKAEIDNLTRRAKIDLENAHKYGIKKLVEDLVPVLDSLEQGLQIEVDDCNETLKQMHTGLQLTYKILLDTVKKYGIEQINPEGDGFNPELHEAVSMIEANNGVKGNTIISVFQKGYILNGRLLRPARVVVAK